MRYVMLLLILTCTFTVSAVQAQEPGPGGGRDQFVSIPREIMFPVIAVQPDCPLKIEKVERLINLDGGGGTNYQLRNVGTKPIRSYIVSFTFDVGTGGSYSWDMKGKELIDPGQLVPSSVQDSGAKTIPLTDQLRDKLGLRGSLKTVVIYMVERVEFADGSVYSDERTAAALRSYFEDKTLRK